MIIQDLSLEPRPARSLQRGTALCSLILCLLSGGCERYQPPTPQTATPTASVVTPAVEQTTPTADTDRQAEINRLLAEADRAFAADQLTEPLDDNAYFLFLRVLSLDEDNIPALQGLDNIVEKYLEWALLEAEAGNLRVATRYLNTARSIDETHPSILAIEKQISDRRSSSQQYYPISRTQLNNRSVLLASELRGIGRSAVEKNATVTIVARTDAEGRWIYQQLNAEVEQRVRARVELGPYPKVQLLF